MGYVYFVQLGNSGDIKIGFSTNIKKRMHTLQTSTPENIQLLGFIAGELPTEKMIHEKFRMLRKKGEWFQCHSSIIEFLNEFNELKFAANLSVHIELDENGKTTLYGKMKM
jgi:hypothetical protein